jgi:hypothetical protein
MKHALRLDRRHFLAGCAADKDWRTASRESAGIAPDPLVTKEAVLQVYGAAAWGWRGWFAIHTWIAAKRTGEPSYTVYEVVGWRQRRGLRLLPALYEVYNPMPYDAAREMEVELAIGLREAGYAVWQA